MFDLTYTKAQPARKIQIFGIGPLCCLLPEHWIFCWPIFYPCLSDIWCACCHRGIEYEFSPNSSVLGFTVVKLCVHTMLLIEAVSVLFSQQYKTIEKFLVVHVHHLCKRGFCICARHLHFTSPLSLSRS